MRRGEEQLGEVAVVPGGSQALVLDAELGVLVLFEPRERDVAQHGQVLAGRGVAHTRVILAKGHVEAPMQRILNAPVIARGAGEAGDIGAMLPM